MSSPAQQKDEQDIKKVVIAARHPQACLDLLPEEILQYIYAYITSPPYPIEWMEL